MDESEELLVPIEEALADMHIVGLPAGSTWAGALLLIKLNDEAGFTWSVRRTDGLSDEELLGQAEVLVEMLRSTIRSRDRT